MNSLADTMLFLHKLLAAEQIPQRREQTVEEMGAADRGDGPADPS